MKRSILKSPTGGECHMNFAGAMTLMSIAGAVVICSLSALSQEPEQHYSSPPPWQQLASEALEEKLIEPVPSDIEVVWSEWLAAKLDAKSEHRLFSGRRVDILTDTTAIEVEWCRRDKIEEAVSQAAYYAAATGRRGAVVLLVGRGTHATERVTCDLVIQAAARRGIAAVAVLDVRDPDVRACREHLGLVR